MAATPVTRYRVDGFACYAVKHSPFYPDKLAVAAAQFFGITGNGRLQTLRTTAPVYQPGSAILPEKASVCELPATTDTYDCHSFDTQDGLYDLAWSEVHENQIVTASGDGSVKLWDVTLDVSCFSLICQC
jgi:peroxin-7